MVVTSIDKTRIGGSKVRTGCRTCKARRVKCTEEKPHCQRCVKAGRKCEGYSPTPSPDLVPAGHKFVHYVCPPGMGSPSRSPPTHAELDLHAVRALEFFHHSTALQLEQTFSYHLWSKTLSRLMQTEPAIKHAVIALATLHENFVYPPQSGIEDQRRLLALEHYGKSIQSVVRVNEKSTADAVLTTLISCLLYCAIESIQSHVPSARKHINAGISLLLEHENKLLEREELGGGVSSGFVDALRQIFISLGTQSVTLEDTSIDETLIRYLQTSDEVADYDFTSTTQALTAVSHLMNDSMQFITWIERHRQNPGYPSEELQMAGDTLQQRFDHWEQAYNNLLVQTTSMPAKCQFSQRMEMLVLRVNELLCRIILNIRFIEDQSGFDNCLDEFKKVVQAAEEMLQIAAQQLSTRRKKAGSPNRSARDDPTFSLTLGVVPGLFFTATRCRDSETRHRALELLKGSHRRESVWDSQVAGEIAERIIMIEEESARHYREMCSYDENTPSSGTVYEQSGSESRSPSNYTVADIPEHARIHTVKITYSTTQNRARVLLLEQGEFQRHEEHFEWRE